MSTQPTPPREIMAEGKFLRMVRQGRWEFAERTNCNDAVVVAPITDDGFVILIEQFRPPIGQKTIEFPAGLIGDLDEHREESYFTAAQRELGEETGYHADVLIPVAGGAVSPGMTTERFKLLVAAKLTRLHDGGGDHTEDIATHLIPRDEVETWLKEKEASGVNIDPKIFAGLYFIDKWLSGKLQP